MPEYCAAYSCTNKRTVETRAHGITFHKFPKSDMRKKWEVALRRKSFTASDSSVLCSEHFKSEDFDRTGQIVRLRHGVIPSIFNFPVRHRPKKGKTTANSRRAEESLPVMSQDASQTSTSKLQPQPPDVEKGEIKSNSQRAEESQSVTSQDAPQTSTSNLQSQPLDDHSYALPGSAVLKARLNEALARVEILQQEKKNTLAREKRLRTRMQSILDFLREKNPVCKERLEFYSVSDLQTDFMVSTTSPKRTAGRLPSCPSARSEGAQRGPTFSPHASTFLKKVAVMGDLKMLLGRSCQEDQAKYRPVALQLKATTRVIHKPGDDRI